MARVTTCGVRLPATSTAPITTSAEATKAATDSLSARQVSTVGMRSIRLRSFSASTSSTVTRAPAAHAVRAAQVPTTPAPRIATFAGGMPGLPPSSTPRPPELERSRCAAMGTVIWPAISLTARSTGKRPSSC